MAFDKPEGSNSEKRDKTWLKQDPFRLAKQLSATNVLKKCFEPFDLVSHPISLLLVLLWYRSQLRLGFLPLNWRMPYSGRSWSLHGFPNRRNILSHHMFLFFRTFFKNSLEWRPVYLYLHVLWLIPCLDFFLPLDP